MPGKNNREEICNCPVGTFFRDVERTCGEKSNFLDHITQSRIEVLKAIRSLVDERIESLGPKKTKTTHRKMKDIRVD
jgi:hypothetical protein